MSLRTKFLSGAKGVDTRHHSAKELASSLGDALHTATVLREVFRSAKGAAARHYSAKELASSLGDALHTATVLREVFNRCCLVASREEQWERNFGSQLRWTDLLQ